MDFVLGLLKKLKKNDYILVVVDRFSKMTNSFPCNKAVDAWHIMKLFIKEVIRLHGLPQIIVFDRDGNELVLKDIVKNTHYYSQIFFCISSTK